MSSYRIGMNLRVTEESNQGGRRYMEDRHAIRFVKNDEGGFEFAYFGIFDGHGGGEASKYARDHLLDEITKYDCFWSDNDDDILYAIKSAFMDTHLGMWKEVDKWPRTASGLPSTAGTTASICIIKNSKLYLGHVGDSAIVLGCNDSKLEKLVKPKAKLLTKEHKPDDPEELKRIEESGGQVVAKSGVQRVVWNRPRTDHKGPIRRSTQIDKIPFLAVARSLGDLWSYNYLKEEFVVSPDPDVSVHKLDPATDKCLIIGSDGLWNMISPEESVASVFDLECQFEYKVINDPSVPLSYWINPAERLVQAALNKWRMRLMKADNTSAIVVLIDPLGPRKLSLLKKKREERMKELAEKRQHDNQAVTDLLLAKESLHKSPKKVNIGKNPVQHSIVHKPVTKPDASVPEKMICKVVVKDGGYGHNQTKVSKPAEKMTNQHMPKGSDSLDDSVQIRNPQLVSPSSGSERPTHTAKHGKSTLPDSKGNSTPLHANSSDSVVKSGMELRSSPHKSPDEVKSVTAVNKASSVNSVNKDTAVNSSHKGSAVNSVTKTTSIVSTNKGNTFHSINKLATTNTSNQGVIDSQTLHELRSHHMYGPAMEQNHIQYKCLQPSKNSSENVDNSTVLGKPRSNLKTKDVENLCSSDVKLGFKNLNLRNAQKSQIVKNVNNSNTSSEIQRSSSKKLSSSQSLSTRISLRLRRLRQKTRGKVKGKKVHSENKGFVAKPGIKRKMDTVVSHSAGTPAAKKIRHS